MFSVLLQFFLNASDPRFLTVFHLAILEQLSQGTWPAATHLQRVVVGAFNDAQLGNTFIGTSTGLASENLGGL